MISLRQRSGSFASAPERFRLFALMAALLFAAQLLVAAHAGARADLLFDHSPASCAVCLAGAASDDPALLVVKVVEPIATATGLDHSTPDHQADDPAILSAEARAPPLC